jgi:hypothetical protein
LTATISPVVVDIGKQKSKDLKALKNGGGPLMDDVAKVLDELRAKSPELAAKDLVPVVIIYRRKAKKTRSMMPFNMMK